MIIKLIIISCWNSRGHWKKVQFQGLIKECNRMLQNFQELSFIFSGIYKGKSGIPRCNQKEIMLNFPKSCFLTLGLPRGVLQFYRISEGKERFVWSRFSKSKVINLKDSSFFFKKVCPQSLFGFFWE